MYTRPIKVTDLTGKPDLLNQVRCVITTFWFTGLASWAKPYRVPVFMVSTRWSAETIEPLRRLQPGSKILLVFYQEDYIHNGQLFANDLRQALDDPGKVVVSTAIREARELRPILRSTKYDRILIGNRIWDDLDEATRGLPNVSRPIVRLNEDELEKVRISAGVIL